MISVNTFFETISYKEIVAPLLDIMAANFKEFAADQARFNETITLLENELGEGTSPSVSDEVDAICQQIGSCLLFSCFLGLKANLDHFIDPIGRTFLDVDLDVYLREDIAEQMPDYKSAQRVLEKFYAILSPAQKDKYENIIAYISHLKTVGPKLAHYYGYVLGNQVFPHVILGYVEDLPLTLRYRHMLKEYLGVRID